MTWFLLLLLTPTSFAHPGGHDYGAVVLVEPAWSASSVVLMSVCAALALIAFSTRTKGAPRRILLTLSTVAFVYGCTKSIDVPEDLMDGNCPEEIAETFFDVEGAVGPGGLVPTLSITCTDTHLIVQSNGVPNYDAGPAGPHDTNAFAFTWMIPRVPIRLDTPAEVLIESASVGVATNGVPIMEPAAGPQDDRVDPIDAGLTDDCNGHADHNGVYHYHGMPVCLFTSDDPDAVAGWSFDGYPMRTPWTCPNGDCSEVTELESSWQYVGGAQAAWDANAYVEGSGDLDACNGRWVDGVYEYRMTLEFPYSVGCYAAEREDQAWNSPFDLPQQE